MSETSGGDTVKVEMRSYYPSVPNAKSSIRCEVTPDGELILLPADALGLYFLTHFGHSGDIHPVWTQQGGPISSNSPYATLLSVTLSHRKPALLTSAGDPYFTGLTISKAEQEACRALVDKMRKPKRRTKKESK